MQETEDIVTRLRDWCMNVRRKPSPLSDAIPMAQEAADTIATLRAEVEGLRADAERYRWLRDKAIKGWERFSLPDVWFVPRLSQEEQTLRGAIDEAIQKEHKGAS